MIRFFKTSGRLNRAVLSPGRFPRYTFPTTTRHVVTRRNTHRFISTARAASGETLARAGSDSSWGWIAGYTASVLLAGGLYAGSRHVNNMDLGPEAEIVALPKGQGVISLEVDEFIHPFDDSSFIWKVYFRTKRFLYLFAVFLPCVTVGGICKLTGSDELRALSLELLVKAFESAGCGLMKFGQWLSMRPDMLAPDVILALSSLRQDTPCHSLEHTRAMLRESFGLDIEAVFEEFDPVPVASGTVAQVHRARLREEYAIKADIRLQNGELARDVAVKVRHPNVIAETWCDVDLIYTFIQATDFLTIPFKKDDFLNTLQRQVDFKREAQNLLQFGENFKKETRNGSISFPIVSVGMLSNCILLESWAGGCSVSTILTKVGAEVKEGMTRIGQTTSAAMDSVDHFADEIVDTISSGADDIVGSISSGVSQTRRELAETLFDVSIKMFLRDNLAHGDLHAGNVMFDEALEQCTIIDAGLTTSLEEDWVRKDFGRFLQALCTGDVEEILGKIVTFHVDVDTDQNASGVACGFASSDPEAKALALANLNKDVKATVDLWVDPNGAVQAPDGGPILLGDLVGALMFSMQRNGVCLRSDVASSLMTMAITEGLVRSLDPDFDLVKKAMPYFVRYGHAW